MQRPAEVPSFVLILDLIPLYIFLIKSKHLLFIIDMSLFNNKPYLQTVSNACHKSMKAQHNVFFESLEDQLSFVGYTLLFSVLCSYIHVCVLGFVWDNSKWYWYCSVFSAMDCRRRPHKINTRHHINIWHTYGRC